MTTSFDDAPGTQAPRAPEAMTRPMYWSIRRELWETRALYLGPLIITAVVLFATLLATISLPKKMRVLQDSTQHVSVSRPFEMAPAPIMLATFVIGLFYSLDALYGERRDRSILFWKALPVSDRTAVLAKASIPTVVLPLIAFVLSVATQLVLLAFGTLLLAGSGLSPFPWWRELELAPGLLIMLYGLTVHALWFSPVYAWLLLVSAWARRAPLLWATLPLFAAMAFERIAFGSIRLVELMKYRVTGAMATGFTTPTGNYKGLSELTPLRFLTTPGLWLGLALAAGFLALAVRVRRRREPI